jgi:hypothetical protein
MLQQAPPAGAAPAGSFFDVACVHIALHPRLRSETKKGAGRGAREHDQAKPMRAPALKFISLIAASRVEKLSQSCWTGTDFHELSRAISRAQDASCR